VLYLPYVSLANPDNSAERFVEDAPKVRFEEKRKLLESKKKSKL
jgi:hypothetical protein